MNFVRKSASISAVALKLTWTKPSSTRLLAPMRLFDNGLGPSLAAARCEVAGGPVVAEERGHLDDDAHGVEETRDALQVLDPGGHRCALRLGGAPGDLGLLAALPHAPFPFDRGAPRRRSTEYGFPLGPHMPVWMSYGPLCLWNAEDKKFEIQIIGGRWGV